MFPLFHTRPPTSFLLSLATVSSPHLPQFFGHLHPSINCQCSSTAINQLFVSSCQSTGDLCQLLLLITRRVRLEGKKRGRERERRKRPRGNWRRGKEEQPPGMRGGGSKKKNERERGAQCQENE